MAVGRPSSLCCSSGNNACSESSYHEASRYQHSNVDCGAEQQNSIWFHKATWKGLHTGSAE